MFCNFDSRNGCLCVFVMCIYRCEISKFSRSKKQSAVAAAAYRSGQKLIDEQDWQTKDSKTHDYTRRVGVVATGILLPEGAPEDFNNRAALWNAAERAEKKCNSLVARECTLALPHELTDEQRLEATTAFAAYIVERYGVGCDYAVHKPDRMGDNRNHHAHVMFTTRSITKDGLGAKTRVLDDKKTGSAEFTEIRKAWETICNDVLSKADIAARVDSRSLKDQGIDRVPEPKQGAIATQMEREGKTSHAGEERRAVKAYNATLDAIEDTDDDPAETETRRKRYVDDAEAEIITARKENRGFAQWFYRRAIALLRLLALQRRRRQQQLQQAWRQMRLYDILRQTWAANDRYGKAYPQRAQAPPQNTLDEQESALIAFLNRRIELD